MGNQRVVKMADSGPRDGGFGGFGGKGKGGKGGKGKGGKGKGQGKGRKGGDKEEWVPCTKLGRLVKEGKIAKLDHIYFYSMAIKEPGIVDHFIPQLKDEVMKIQPVQKQTSAGQRMKFKAYVIVGDFDGHVGLGVKGAKEVATAIRGAIARAKLSLVPVLRGYWGNKIGLPHTVPCKVTGKSGSVRMRLSQLLVERVSSLPVPPSVCFSTLVLRMCTPPLVVPHPPWVTSSRLHSPQLPTPTPTTSQLTGSRWTSMLRRCHSRSTPIGSRLRLRSVRPS